MNGLLKILKDEPQLSIEEVIDLFGDTHTVAKLGYTTDNLITYLAEAFQLVKKYREFIRFRSELRMYAPCDEERDVMKEPEHYALWAEYGEYSPHGIKIVEPCRRYKEAKDRVLYKGFNLNDGILMYNGIIQGRALDFTEIPVSHFEGAEVTPQFWIEAFKL